MTGVVGAATLFAAACVLNAPTGPGSAAAAADLGFCLSETNRYRAMANRAALSQSAQLDEYAAAAAEYDGTRHVTHAYANSIHPDAGFVRFENEIPWWRIATYGTVRAVVRDGIAAMWAQGPAGEHYQSLTHPGVTQLGCGIYVGNGEVTVVQTFR